MRLLKLLVFSGMAFAGYLVFVGRRERLARRVVTTDPADAVLDPSVRIGISDVDASPIVQVSGEGIDLDAADALEPRDQRERIPVPGKDIP